MVIFPLFIRCIYCAILQVPRNQYTTAILPLPIPGIRTPSRDMFQYTTAILPLPIPNNLNYNAETTVIDSFFSIEFTAFYDSFRLYYSDFNLFTFWIIIDKRKIYFLLRR